MESAEIRKDSSAGKGTADSIGMNNRRPREKGSKTASFRRKAKGPWNTDVGFCCFF